MTTNLKDGHLDTQQSKRWIQGKNHSIYTTIDYKLFVKLQRVAKEEDRNVSSEVREIVRQEVYHGTY